MVGLCTPPAISRWIICDAMTHYRKNTGPGLRSRFSLLEVLTGPLSANKYHEVIVVVCSSYPCKQDLAVIKDNAVASSFSHVHSYPYSLLARQIPQRLSFVASLNLPDKPVLPDDLTMTRESIFLTALIGFLSLSSLAQSSSSCGPAPSGAIKPSVASGFHVQVVATGLSKPRGLLIDNAGNLLVVEQGRGVVSAHTLNENGGCISVGSSVDVTSRLSVCAISVRHALQPLTHLSSITALNCPTMVKHYMPRRPKQSTLGATMSRLERCQIRHASWPT